jgi:hypothetical protein
MDKKNLIIKLFKSLRGENKNARIIGRYILFKGVFQLNDQKNSKGTDITHDKYY